MDEMPSAQFRKKYASLTKPTVVTVLGRRIGVWHPVITTTTEVGSYRLKVEEQVQVEDPAQVIRDTFNRRPFTPVPKHR